jgi:hypothetical protein
MSTPLVAGHLALARQYFRDGYYPTGATSDLSSAPFEPSGMLLKVNKVNTTWQSVELSGLTSRLGLRSQTDARRQTMLNLPSPPWLRVIISI